VVDTQAPESALFPERVGDRLRAARMKAGLELSDIATKTRVPLRHLQSIESGDYASLPSKTYAVGFVKAYARTVGEDEVSLADSLRIELGEVRAHAEYDAPGYEDADPSRMPTRLLAWTAAALALLVAIGYGIWLSQRTATPEAPEAVEQTVAPQSTANSAQTAPPPAANPAGQVILTAKAPVWLRIYDANDKVLFEKEMAAGEAFTVPSDANNPQIRTGRAELIGVTIDGRDVAPLGKPEQTIKNVPISAAALTARVPEPAAALAPVATNSAAAVQP
jgi:cytoskeleton protein RodZ